MILLIPTVICWVAGWRTAASVIFAIWLALAVFGVMRGLAY